MSALARLRSFASALARRRRLEREMAEEWRHHLESRADALEAEGLGRAEAMRRARLEFGDPLRWREQGREARGLGWIQDLGADMRYAFRQMRRAPGFTFIVVVTFALGIGSSTAIFSAVDAVALRALPFDQHDRLVAVGPQPQRASGPVVTALTPQDYLDWHARQDVFEGLTGYAARALNMEQPDRATENVQALMASSEFFDVLRVQPLIGRGFSPDADATGRETVAVLSYGFWQSHFGGDPKAIGGKVRLQGFTYEIVGVMPPSFSYPVAAVPATDVWVPLVIPPDDRIRSQSHNFYILAVARLKDGVSVERASDRMSQLSTLIASENPGWADHIGNGTVVPLADQVIGTRTRSWMLLLLGAVLLVLLVACVNVAGLVLARGLARQKELGIRAAIGAGRWRIVRQLLVETVVLSAVGAAIGVALARGAVEILRAAMPDNVPRVASIALDGRVLALAIGAAFVAGLLAGLLPAWQCSRPDLTVTLKDGGRSASTSRAGRRARSLLVVGELALAVVLLVGAGLFIASFVKLMRIDLGFNPKSVLTASVFTGYGADAQRGNAALLAIIERLKNTPGVTAVAAAFGTTPVTTMMATSRVSIPGRVLERDEQLLMTAIVSPEFYRALGIPLVAGRLFDDRDASANPPSILLGALTAQKLFPGEDPIGREVDLLGMGPNRIVGVVGDVRWPETAAMPIGYLLLRPQPSYGGGSLVIKTRGEPTDVVPAVRSALYDILPDVPLRDVQTMDQIVWRRTAQRRLNMLLLGLFGVLGLAIAVVGIYGLMAYIATEQTREIGIRLALGATPGQVVRIFLRRAAGLVLAGVSLGTAGAWAVRSAAAAFLFQMDPGDPRIFVAALALLAATALAASFIPAHRAAAIDPLNALRTE